MPEFNRPALLTPVGALDPDYRPQQSPRFNEADPFDRAIDARQQSIIEAQSRLESIKDNKWARIGRALSAGGAGLAGRNPQAVLQPHYARVDALNNQINQGRAGIEDLNLQRAMLEQKQQQQRGGPIGSPQRLQNGNLGMVVENPDGTLAVRDLGVGYDRNKIQLINGVPHAITPEGAVPLMGGDEFRQTGEQSAEVKGMESEAGTRGSKMETRKQGYIDAGMNAVDALPETLRAVDLLQEVQTGGWSNAAIKAKKWFGIEAADEGELDYLLSKAVLSQLKQTFGAAFTKDEAQRLEDIEAGLSRNPETNRRILDQGLKKWERALRRAQIVAEDVGDPIALAEVEEAMEMLAEWKAQREQRQQDMQRDPAEQAADANQGAVDTSGFKILNVED